MPQNNLPDTVQRQKPDKSNTEGVYRMAAPDKVGTYIQVPYSHVAPALRHGYSFQDASEQNRYKKDFDSAEKEQHGWTHQLSAWADRHVPNIEGDDEWGPEGRFVTNSATRMLRNFAHLPEDLKHIGQAFIQDPESVVQRIGPGGVVPLMQMGIQTRATAKTKGLNQAGSDLVGDLGTMYLTGKAVSGGLSGIARGASRIAPLFRQIPETLAGSAIDDVIPGDTVTPRERYHIARNQGVDLDLAQATEGTLAGKAKQISEQSMFGANDYRKLRAANAERLNQHATQLLDEVAPSMSRDSFGAAAQQALQRYLKHLYDSSQSVVADLGMRATQPDLSPVRSMARQIIDEQGSYYNRHPELLHGDAETAWKSIQNLAEEPTPAQARHTGLLDANGNMIVHNEPARPAGWAQLQQLHHDLSLLRNSPAMRHSPMGDLLQQVTGALEGQVEGPASGLSPADLQRYRHAAALRGEFDNIFSDERNPLFQIVHAGNGLAAADLLAQLTPSDSSYLMERLPSLAPHLQRQMMERMLSPSGNLTPEWTTLRSRVTQAGKEALAGTLTPQQIQSIEDLARTWDLVNTPGKSENIFLKNSDPAAVGWGAKTIAEGLGSGDHTKVARGALMAGMPVARKAIAKAITNPEFVERVMQTPLKGEAAWIENGAKALADAGVDTTIIRQLRSTASGRELLSQAGNLTPGSKGMTALLRRLPGL
ncbi:MAG: hypothetical protein HOQ35_07510 [Acidobacteriaceae bacterium]|nr:hypothetical protein [Acidobacteriaceae bacterium]